MKTPVTKQEWIDALTKAKKDALLFYPDSLCVFSGCWHNGVDWGNAKFDVGGLFIGDSDGWMMRTKPSRAQVAAVFDNSIQRIKEM